MWTYFMHIGGTHQHKKEVQIQNRDFCVDGCAILK